jgi:VanZ family protein
MLALQPDPLHLVLREPLLGPVVELGGARAFVRGHFLCVLERAAIARYAVIPVARNVWQPISAVMPAALARARRSTPNDHVHENCANRAAQEGGDRIASRAPMRFGLLRTLIRFLTWCCVVLLAFLSLLPAEDMAWTGFPGELEHFAAYAGSVAIGMAGYGLNDSRLLVIGSFWLYAGVLEYLQHFSPGRRPAFLDFAASALGALCGGLAVVLLSRWRSGLLLDGTIRPGRWVRGPTPLSQGGD